MATATVARNGKTEAHPRDLVDIPIPDVPWLSTARFYAHLEGRSPILMSNGSAMLEERDGARSSKTSKVPGREAEAKAAEYRLPTGELYMPTAAFWRALVDAGTHFQDPNYKKGTLSGPVAASVIFDDPETLLLGANDEPLREYEIDTRRCVLKHGSASVAVARSRPIIREWFVDLSMEYEHLILPPEMLLQVLQMAGNKIGVGNFRPQKKGPYGKWQVTSFRVEA